jgi:hypothetical protein
MMSSFRCGLQCILLIRENSVNTFPYRRVLHSKKTTTYFATRYKASTKSMTLKEEKDLMQRIKKLKASRPEAVKKAADLEQMKAENEASMAPVDGSTVEEQLTKVRMSWKIM